MFNNTKYNIVNWDNLLIDGHNRYEIAQRHDLEFEVREVEFENENDAKVWIIQHQFGRRNLADFVKYELEQVKAAIQREKGREKLSEAGNKGNQIRWNKESPLSIFDKGDKMEKHDTRKEIAMTHIPKSRFTLFFSAISP